MPAAIQFRTTVAVAPRSDQRLRVHSTNFDETVEFALPGAEARRGDATHWVDYVAGVAQALRDYGVPLHGADLMIHGEVPLGSGLSSSAALEVAVALALSTLAGRQLEPLNLALLCQRAENEYVGNRCGIMDQFAAACGRAGHALMIDCRSLEMRLVPLQRHLSSVRLVICNTMVRHQLAGGEYNRRREECEQGVRALSTLMPRIEALRDVTPEGLQAHRNKLDPLIYRRCRHIVTENARVCDAAAALQAADLDRFGELMRESHQSLRDDYQVSCDELDLMVRLAGQVSGVYGARMTGGGFGGCTVNLVQSSAVARFSAQVADRYAQATGHRPEIYVCEAVDGAAAVSIQ
jgi:galactokinase